MKRFSPYGRHFFASIITPLAVLFVISMCLSFEIYQAAENSRVLVLVLINVVVSLLTFAVGVFFQRRLGNTDIVRSERLLRESQERLGFALQSAKFGTWEIDLATDKVSASKEMLKIWNIAPEEFNQERALLQNKVHVEDRERMAEAIKVAIQSDTVYEMDYRIAPQPGEEKWVLSRGRCSYEPGFALPSKFTGIVTDITNRKLREEHDRVLFELSGSGAAEMDPATNLFVRVNKRFTELTGYSEAELKGMTLADLAAPVADAVSDLGWKTERRYIRKDGTDLWVYCSRYVQRNSEGAALNILNTFYDITDLKKTQLALQDAMKARDHFLSIASHELKTPLTSLQLQIQLRQRDLGRNDMSSELLEKLRHSLDVQYQYVRRISVLIDDILDVSRIAEGKLSYRFEHFDVCVIVKEVIERFRVNANASNIEIEFDGCRPVIGRVDRFRIEQVILNLLTNGARYGRGRPLHLRVWSDPTHVFFSIKDNGIGIKKEDHERIFNRFERAISENEVSGLGLGLFVSKEIVKAHGGDILVTSEVGAGSEFTISLPTMGVLHQ